MRAASYQEVDAKSVTRIPGTVDAWFLSRYGMNLYRGCEHGCVYCDGRAEKYYVEGDFARDIRVKRNAVAVLDRELSRVREPGFVCLGGGVCDAYQPAEAEYGLARGVLELVLKYRLPVHVLTKSALVERDLDLLEAIGQQRQVILSFSIQAVDEALRERFEGGAAPFAERWRILAEARARGLATAVMAMPVLPGLSDQPESIARLVDQAAEVGVDFLCFGGLTLRPGRQKQGYLEVIRETSPDLLAGYHKVYGSNRASGAADPRYYDRVNHRFLEAMARHGLPARAPRRLFQGQIPRYAEAAVLLEHQAFARRAAGGSDGGLARAGVALQTWARALFAKHRSRRYDWREVEQELRRRVADESILSLPGMCRAALPILAEVGGGTD